jgi:hypothetical protein
MTRRTKSRLALMGALSLAAVWGLWALSLFLGFPALPAWLHTVMMTALIGAMLVYGAMILPNKNSDRLIVKWRNLAAGSAGLFLGAAVLLAKTFFQPNPANAIARSGQSNEFLFSAARTGYNGDQTSDLGVPWPKADQRLNNTQNQSKTIALCRGTGLSPDVPQMRAQHEAVRVH